MDETSTNLGLPYLQAAQAQKHLTHNAALEQLDMIVQLSVQSFAENTPPLTPDEGQVWAVGPAPVNDWAAHEGALAAYANGGWLFITPRLGWRAAQGTELRIWDGAVWVDPDMPALQNLPGVGVNTSYDSTNKLAVASDATLLTHDGAGHQLKLNKAAAGDTASLLYQSGWSGRAEMGLVGSDDFAIKVSPDGSAWTTAIAVNAATGESALAGLTLTAALSPASGGTGVANNAAATLTRSGDHPLTLTTSGASALTLPTTGTLVTQAGAETLSNKTLTAPVINTAITGTAVVSGGTDVTAGRLLTTGAGAAQAFRRGNVLATVAQSAGVPSGGLIERGSNANGEYVRFADGTQMCWSGRTAVDCTTPAGALYMTSSLQSWTFPAAFSASPLVFGSGGTTSRSIAPAVPGATSVAFRVLSVYNDAVTFAPQLAAIGRWF